MLNQLLFSAQSGAHYNSLHDYFSNPRLQVEYVPYLLGALFVLAILLVIGVKLLRWNIKRQAYIPRGTVRDLPTILRLLNKCIDKRVKMDFQFDLDLARHNFATSMPVNVNAQALVLECSKQSVPVFALQADRDVVFYFTIKDEGTYYHYRFESKVIKIEPEQNDFLNLFISLPQAIYPGQKRNFLRIPPPEQLILGLSIWPVKRDENNRIETQIAKWGKPLLTYLHEDASQFTLNDISSNGVSIIFPKQHSSLPTLPLGKARHFVLLLDLWDPSHQAPLRIWALCRIQKSVVDFATQNLHIGVQFIAWSTPLPDNPELLKWVKLEEQEEITALGDWIVQRHLEEYREKHQLQ